MLFWPFGLAASAMWLAVRLIGPGSSSDGGILDAIRTLAILGVPFMVSAYLIRRARA